MTPVILALALAGQYPTPQTVQYQAPAQLQVPIASVSGYATPASYTAPQLVLLGTGQVVPPGHFGLMLGAIGERLQRHAWPRVQPLPMQAPVQQTVYLQVSQPVMQQAVYTVSLAQPSYQYQPPVQYAAPPMPAKATPQTYSSPQAPRPSESVPPVPPR